MVIIIDKRLPFNDRLKDATLIEVDLNSIYSAEDIVEDRMLFVYKLAVEHGADIVMLADKEVTESLMHENMLSCYINIKDMDE